ncbi:MAG: hypothetical protein AMS26_01875 [Bacteroides sp. SM23_62]|nr:MAG: hypothetical protein AMS26_01875 [Bacteroides sp. SM23_62]
MILRIIKHYRAMKPKVYMISVLLMLLSVQIIAAQDRIIKRDGEIIECKVEEIGSEEIKYILAEYGPDLQFGILKSKVEKIMFENGREMLIDHLEFARETTEMNSIDLFQVQRRNAIKMAFLSPLTGITSFSYERALKPGRSIEFTLSLIGLGFNNPEDAAGLGLKAGYKFIRSPDHYIRGMRYAHILKGGYVRPEFSFAKYNLRSKNEDVVKAALMVNIGKQWVFSDVFLLDLYFGAGYGMTTSRIEDPEYPHDFVVVDPDFPLALDAGFRLGFLIK